MWRYYSPEEIYHTGVIGMRWGRHKALKNAKLEYHNKLDKSYAKYDNNMISIEKGYKKGQNLSVKDQKRELDNDTRYMAEVNKHETEYKNKVLNIKNDFKNKIIKRKNDIKNNYKEIQKETSFGQKLLYNNATRRLAAKNMVDKQMSKKVAIDSAKKTALRNTALAAIAGISYMAVSKLK